jgi:FxsC-like protein
MTTYYNFFFSFASTDWKKGKKDDLEVFFKDLRAKLKEFGLEGSGFFAPDTIERGQEWEKELEVGLRTSAVLVPIYSPNYFKSVWCGREWEVFWQRQQENRNRPPDDVSKPDVILPVVWTADPLQPPARVEQLQYDRHVAIDAAGRARGLGYMMQSPRRFPGKYEDFVHEFGTKLFDKVKAQGAAKMRPIPMLEELDLPFPENYKRGLSYVQYVFLVGRIDEMVNLRTQRDCYGIYEDRRDWRPCFPDIEKAGDLARDAATGNDKGYEFICPSKVAELIRALRDASARNNIIAVVVDPWSLKLGTFKEFAEKFDDQPFPSSGVIVTLNKKDDETLKTLPIIKNTISGHFRRRIKRQEYYKEGVSTPEELREALIAAFNSARERLVESGKIRSVGPPDAAPQPLLHVAP